MIKLKLLTLRQKRIISIVIAVIGVFGVVGQLMFPEISLGLSPVKTLHPNDVISTTAVLSGNDSVLIDEPGRYQVPIPSDTEITVIITIPNNAPSGEKITRLLLYNASQTSSCASVLVVGCEPTAMVSITNGKAQYFVSIGGFWSLNFVGTIPNGAPAATFLLDGQTTKFIPIGVLFAPVAVLALVLAFAKDISDDVSSADHRSA